MIPVFLDVRIFVNLNGQTPQHVATKNNYYTISKRSPDISTTLHEWEDLHAHRDKPVIFFKC